MNQPLSPTVNIHGAADLMKVHYKSVTDLINEGVLPAARVGRAYVLLTKDVMAHIENEVIKQTALRMRRPAAAPTTKARRKAPSHAGAGSA